MPRTTQARAWQLVVAEIAVAAVVVATFGPGWVLIGVGALAAAVLVATFGRAGGRWWYEAVARERRFRRRRKLAAEQVLAAAVGATAGPPHLPWLRTLAPTLQLRSVQVGTATVGVGTDQDGWFAAVDVGSLCQRAPQSQAEEIPRRARSERQRAPQSQAKEIPRRARSERQRAPQSQAKEIPLAELASLLEPGPDRAAVSSVQVILAPGGSPGEARPAWVAVRVTPADALATERAGGVAAVERSVAAAALRAARTLDGHGWSARAVGRDGLLAVLVEATGLDGPPQEHWSVWQSGRLVRTHYSVVGWTPAHGTLALGVSQVAVSFNRRGEPAVLAAVAAQPMALTPRIRAVVRACAVAGVRLQRLDGEQAPAAYACAPTAMPLASLGLRSREDRERGRTAGEPTGAGRMATSSTV